MTAMRTRPLHNELLDEQPIITAGQAEQKLRFALARLGLGFADAAHFVSFDPDADSAYWSLDRRSGKERICIGPLIATLDVEAIEVALRHELLHRSMYHGFSERYTDHGLANLTLDICINRLLYAAYPAAMRRLSQAVYPAESKTTPVALADCTAQATRLPDPLRDLWLYIWHRSGPTGDTLNPSSLYYQLLRVDARAGLATQYVASDMAATALPSTLAQQAIDRVLSDLARDLPQGTRLAAALAAYTVSPVTISAHEAERFVRTMRVRTAVHAAVGAVLEHLRETTRIQPYPLLPTRLGIVYRALGVSAATGLHWNRERPAAGRRLALTVYVDVSGSMESSYPVVTSLVNALKGYPLRVRAFDTAVRDVDLAAFVDGTIVSGLGTDFDAPIADLADDREVTTGLLITDGEAQVSSHVARTLARNGKQLYVIYLRERSRGHTPHPDPLGDYAAATIELSPSMLTLS